jgi:hypothetical protein
VTGRETPDDDRGRAHDERDASSRLDDSQPAAGSISSGQRAAHDMHEQLDVLRHHLNSAIRHTRDLQSRSIPELTDTDLAHLLDALAQVRHTAARIAVTADAMSADARDDVTAREPVRSDE